MKTFSHKFVDDIPRTLDPETLYISMEYGTVVHNCCCGCGNRVVTPLTPTDWRLIFDGETVSLYPSIGNWSLECQSHYWIRNNRVEWAKKLSKEEIEIGRQEDRAEKARYFGEYGPNNSQIKRGKKENRRFWDRFMM
jgi:hypothetical protein